MYPVVWFGNKWENPNQIMCQVYLAPIIKYSLAYLVFSDSPTLCNNAKTLNCLTLGRYSTVKEQKKNMTKEVTWRLLIEWKHFPLLYTLDNSSICVVFWEWEFRCYIILYFHLDAWLHINKTKYLHIIASILSRLLVYKHVLIELVYK